VIERLRADGLAVRRGGRTVVGDLDRVFVRGRTQWVVGDNGDGKSSLLRVLAGRDRPHRGRLEAETAGGERVPRPTTVYFAPAMRIPPDVRVGDWRRLAGAAAGARTADRTAGRPVPGGGAPGIGPASEPDRRVGRTSTGQAKRLLLEGLLALPAHVTVLDEPFEHLAPAARRRLTRSLARRAARSVVVVATHHDLPAGVAPGDVLTLQRTGAGPERASDGA